MAYLPEVRHLTSWKIRSAYGPRPTSNEARRNEELRRSDACRSFKVESARSSSCEDLRQRRILGSYKKFGDMDVILATTNGGHQVTLIEHHGHLFLNGKEIRLSRDHLVKLPDESPAPVSFQSCYDAAVQCRRKVLPERVIINSTIYRSQRSNNATSSLRETVRGVIDRMVDLSKENIFEINRKKSKETSARFTDKKDQLVCSLYALNECSIQVAKDFTDIVQNMRAKDENTKVLTRAVKQLCEEAIQVSLREKLATKDARQVKGKIRSLQNENEQLKLNLSMNDKALEMCEMDLDQKRQELSSADRKIAEQRRRIEELERERQLAEKEQNEKKQLHEEVLNLKGNEIDMRERFNRLEVEKKCQENKLISLQKELEDIRETQHEQDSKSNEALKKNTKSIGGIQKQKCMNIENATESIDLIKSVSSAVSQSNPIKNVSKMADRLQAKLTEAEQLIDEMEKKCIDLVQFQGINTHKYKNKFKDFELLHTSMKSQASELSKLLKLTEMVYDNDGMVHQLLTGSTKLTKVPEDGEQTKSVTKWRDKFKLLAGKTRTYREELGRVSTERDQLKKHKKHLAELVRGAISDRVAVTTRVVSMETRSHTARNTNIRDLSQEAQIRHLVWTNQELEKKILAKECDMKKELEIK